MPVRNSPVQVNDRLAQARAAAKNRGQLTDEGPDWPKWDAIELDTAMEELTIASYEFGVKVGMGLMNDGSAVWCRLTYPGDCTHHNAGCVAFTVSDTMDKVIRKAVQLLDVHSPRVWKADQYVSDREKSALRGSRERL